MKNKNYLILVFALMTGFFPGCQRSKEGESASPSKTKQENSIPQVQVRIGDGNEEEWGLLSFEILKVHTNQKLTEAFPWHSDGGNWTFLDCRISGPSSIDFTIGKRGHSNERARLTGGNATILVKNAEGGSDFIKAFCHSFKSPPPKERTRYPLEVWTFNTVALGNNLNRDPNGGFSGESGTWTADKCFIEQDGYYAEFYFNFSVAEMKGEFSEKDPDYRNDLVDTLSLALRDGPRPERTQETDPNLAAKGPTFDNGQLVAKRVGNFHFSADSNHIVYSTESDNGPVKIQRSLVSDLTKTELLDEVQHRLDRILPLDSSFDEFLVEETVTKDKRSFSSEDPEKFWRIHHSKQSKRELQGPWAAGGARLEGPAVSHDGKYVLLNSWISRNDGEKKGKYRVYHIYDLISDSFKNVEIKNESIDLLGWRVKDGKNYFIFKTGYEWDEKPTDKIYICDPATGAFEEVEKPEDLRKELKELRFSGGKYSASLEGSERLVFTDLKTAEKKSFLFHEDDRRLVDRESMRWISPRYIYIMLNRVVLLDAETMKMSYPLTLKDDASQHQFSSDFKWVLWTTSGQDLYLSPIKIPD